MNENIKKYGIPVVIGVVILYFIFRMQRGGTSSTSTINRLVPLQGENNTQQQQRDAARVSAFSALAGVAGNQIAAEAQQGQILGGQEIERIRGGFARELGLQNLEAIKTQIAGQEEANRILSADRRYDIDQQLVAQDRMFTAQQGLYNLQAENAFRTLMAQISAVGNIGQQYRGQSLERQGTILNALSAIWNQPRVYDYQSAFGGARPPGFFQSGGGFDTITRGVSRFFSPIGF